MKDKKSVGKSVKPVDSRSKAVESTENINDFTNADKASLERLGKLTNAFDFSMVTQRDNDGKKTIFVDALECVGGVTVRDCIFSFEENGGVITVVDCVDEKSILRGDPDGTGTVMHQLQKGDIINFLAYVPLPDRPEHPLDTYFAVCRGKNSYLYMGDGKFFTHYESSTKPELLIASVAFDIGKANT